MKRIFAMMACCMAMTAAYAVETTEAEASESPSVGEKVLEAASTVSTPMPSSAAGAAATPGDWNRVIDKFEKYVKVSGYLQTGYNYNSSNGASSFQAKRLRLILDGQLIKNGSVRIQIEAFNGIAGSTNGNGQKNIQVMDAFFTYKFKPAFQVRVGQFYTPMGYENYDISPATLETVDFSNICYRMACRNAIGYDFVDYGRDLGVMLMGDLFPSKEGFNHLSYNLALTNGSLPTKDDTNKSKDFIGALTIRPAKMLNMKLAYNYGQYKGSEYNYTPMNRFIGGIWYNNPTGFDLRAEYGWLNSVKNGQTMAKESGFYALAAYHAGQFLPVVRYDMYHDSMNKTSTNNYNRVLVGCTWQPLKALKVQANYALSLYNDDVKAANGNKGTASQVQIMGLFMF